MKIRDCEEEEMGKIELVKFLVEMFCGALGCTSSNIPMPPSA
jgi:hypothetical protein